MRQSFLSRVNRDLSSATAVEYALLAGLVGVAAIGAFAGLGRSLDDNFGGVQSSFDQTSNRPGRISDGPEHPSGKPGVADTEEEATERNPDHGTGPVLPRARCRNRPRSRIPSDQWIPPPDRRRRRTDRPVGTSTGPLDTVSNAAGLSSPATGGTGDGLRSPPVAAGQTETALEELRLAEIEAEEERAEAEAAAAEAETEPKKDKKEKKDKRNEEGP